MEHKYFDNGIFDNPHLNDECKEMLKAIPTANIQHKYCVDGIYRSPYSSLLDEECTCKKKD